jgi:hypothetical protein
MNGVNGEWLMVEAEIKMADWMSTPLLRYVVMSSIYCNTKGRRITQRSMAAGCYSKQVMIVQEG